MTWLFTRRNQGHSQDVPEDTTRGKRRIYVGRVAGVWMQILSIASCLLLASAECSSQQLSSPVYVTFDINGDTPEKKLDRIRLINEFCPEHLIMPIDEKRIASMSEIFHRFSDPDGFEPAGGIAQCLDSQGVFRLFRFRTVAGHDGFEGYVADQAAKRGESVRVDRTNNQILMSDAGPGRILPSGAVARWSDVFIAFADNIVAWGGERHVFQAPFSQLSSVAEKGRGHDWCLFAAPSSVPARFREAFLRLVEIQTGVILQQRDNELPEDYAIRRIVTEQFYSLVRQGISDIDELVFYMDEPTSEAGFRAHLDMKIASKSDLSMLIRDLRGRGTSVVQFDSETLVAFNASLGIPGPWKNSLRTTVSSSSLRETPVAAALLRLIDNGSLDAGVTVKSDSHGIPSVDASLMMDLSSAELSWLASLLKGALLTEDIYEIPGPTEFKGERFPDYQLTCSRDDDRLHVQARLREPTSNAARNSPPVDNTATQQTNVLALKVDLHSLANFEPDSAATKLLIQAERMYQYVVGKQNPMMLRFRGAEPLDEFTSLASRIQGDGDWTLQLNIYCDSDGERLVADCKVGRELYGLFLARRLVTQSVVFRMRTPPTTRE